MDKQIKTTPSISTWILFSSLGWIIGFILAVLLADPLEKFKLEWVGIGFAISGGIGLMQWIVLYKYARMDSKWLWLSIAGMGVSFLILDIIIVILNALDFKYKLDGPPIMVFTIFTVALGSYCTGYLQEKFILRKYFKATDGWVRHTMLGWMSCVLLVTVYMTISGKLNWIDYPLGKLMNMFVTIMGGPLIGYFTGKKLLVILNSGKKS